MKRAQIGFFTDARQVTQTSLVTHVRRGTHERYSPTSPTRSRHRRNTDVIPTQNRRRNTAL
jgi:hypothetical protein